MKFLTFVDLHDDKKHLHYLVERAKKDDIDFIVCAGDISQFGRGLVPVLKKFNNIRKKFYLIPGNHETDEMFSEAARDYRNVINFNRRAVLVGDYVFLGYGEGGFVQEDAEFRKVAREWYGRYNGKKIIFVAHGPPYGTKIDKMNKQFVGNTDYSKFIHRIKPKLVICGHLHETANTIDEIEGVKMVNPGWEGMVIELV